MKINEKIVSYFESCNSPVDKQGYLSKKGEIKTSYQKRWFVLKGNLLFYKERPVDRDVTGVIVLEGCTVQLCESEEQFAFSLLWNEPGLRTYKFAAESQASQESWIKALLSASHSYMSLLVMDMERKYRDALSTFYVESKKPFRVTNVHAAEPDCPAAWLNTHASTQSSSPAHVLGAGAPLSSSQRLQLLPGSVSKRSPKLRPKQIANMAPAGATAVELSTFFSYTEEDFQKLHEDFGKEVKGLIADWTKKRRGGGDAQEDNLIDFG